MSTQRVGGDVGRRGVRARGPVVRGSTVMVVGTAAASSRTSSAGRHVDCRPANEAKARSTTWATAAESSPTWPPTGGRSTAARRRSGSNPRAFRRASHHWWSRSGVTSLGFGGSAVHHRFPFQPPPLPRRRRPAQGGLNRSSFSSRRRVHLAGPLREIAPAPSRACPAISAMPFSGCRQRTPRRPGQLGTQAGVVEGGEGALVDLRCRASNASQRPSRSGPGWR